VVHRSVESTLANGQLLPVHRTVVILQKDIPREYLIKKTTIQFMHGRQRVKWEDNDRYSIQALPEVLDFAGNDPVLVTPVIGWGACKKYDFPQEGVVAFAYRNGDWHRVALAELPPNLSVNLLHSGIEHWEHKLVTPKDKIEPNWQLRQGAPVSEVVEKYANYNAKSSDPGSVSCARLNPPRDPEFAAAVKMNIAAEANARVLTAQVKSSSATPEVISKDDYWKAKGKWTGATYLQDSCEGIVEDVDPIREMTPDGVTEDGLWKSVGDVLTLADGGRIPMREFGLRAFQGPASVQAVVCSGNVIFTVKGARVSDQTVKNQLIVHRFSRTGGLIDALRINFANLGQFFPPEEWPQLWEMRVMDGQLEITFGKYSYERWPTDGGVLDHRVTYTVPLPTG